MTPTNRFTTTPSFRWRGPPYPTGSATDLRATETRLAPMSLHLFAGLRVRDLQAAQPWYEQLFGEPSFFPNSSEAVWTLADDRSVYIVEDADGAGHSVVTLFLDDLDARVAAVA